MSKRLPAGLRDAGTIENEAVGAPTAHAAGERLTVTHGDLEETHDATPYKRDDRAARTVGGAEVQSFGECYVAAEGPNKGQVMQETRDVGTGELVAVPVSRLRRKQGARGCSRPVSRGFRFDDSEQARASRESRWKTVRPGVRRLGA